MIAVIPAAGEATRFGGIYKELLPIGPGEFLLTAAIKRARALGATRTVLVTRATKVLTHQRFLQEHLPDEPIQYLVQTTRDDLWGALRLTLPLRERSLLVLPDTVWTAPPNLRIPRAPISFGVFRTHTPERFSVIKNGQIHTKDQTLRGPHWAWGAVYWSAEVSSYWLEWEAEHGPFGSYDAAFQTATAEFGAGGWEVTRYEDLGSWESYRRYLIAEAL